jgi:CHAT domain-containing protein/tetratricopeptide (TPR) repeat protein
MASPGRGPFLCLVLLIGSSGAALGLLGSRSSPVAVKGSDPQTQVAPSPVQPSPSAIVRSFTLEPGKARIQELAAGEIHRYPFTLKMGQVLLLFIDQAPRKKDAVDVKIALKDPLGQLLYEVDHPRGAEGTEEAHLVARSAGLFAVEISAPTAGTYQILCRMRPRASRADKLNSRAEEVYFRAKNLVHDDPLHYQRAVGQFLAAEDLWSQAGDKERQADALTMSIATLSDPPTGQWEEILRGGERLAKLRRKLGDRESEARAFVYIGSAHEGLSQPHDAEKDFRTALKLTEARFPKSAALAMRKLGVLLAQEHETNDALKYLEKSFQIFENGTDLRERWNALEALGRTHALLGDSERALDYLQKSVRLAEGLQSKDLLSRSYTRIGDTYLANKQLKDSEFFYNRALLMRRVVGNPRGEAVVLGDISLVYREQGRFRDALKLQQDALNVYRQVNDFAAQTTALCNLGLIFLDMQDPIQASQNFERCGELASAQQDREGEINSFYGEALAQRDRNNSDLARLAVERAIKVIEEVGPRTLREGVKNDFVQARIYSYELLIDLLVGTPPGRPSEGAKRRAFEASESDRWRTLLESLGRDRQRVSLLKPGDASLVAEVARLTAKLERTDEEIRRIGDRSPQGERLKKDQGRIIRSLRIVQGRLGSSQVERPEPISLSEAQQLLDRDTAVLEYFLGKSRSFLFFLTSSNLEVFVLPERSKLETACEQYHLLISESQIGSSATRATAAGYSLREMLLGQVSDRLTSKMRLIIVPDGAIHKVPFVALPATSQGEMSRGFLVETHEISYIPSLSVLRALRSKVSRRAPAPRAIAVIAAPSLGTDYEVLRDSRREGEAVLSLAPAAKSLGVFGGKASRAFVLSGELKHYRYILFSTHGEDHPEQSELSSLALSGRGLDGKQRSDHLWLQDIKGLELPADLVVLSACRTALGKRVPGEGYVGLPQGFLSAGAARAVVSLWNVNESSAADLTVRLFHGVLKESLTPSQALRAAQLWMLNRKEWKAPYYWAGFDLYGEWR